MDYLVSINKTGTGLAVKMNSDIKNHGEEKTGTYLTGRDWGTEGSFYAHSCYDVQTVFD